MRPVFWTTEEMLSLKNGLLPSTKSKKASIAKLNGLKRPCRKLFHEHFEYEGTNWSWKKGSWICTNTKVRNTGKYNLCKVLWEKFHGIYPDANHDVRFKDGNKYNLKKSNLQLLTKSEAQKLRMKDPNVKANTYATGCLGLLMNTIAELQDPSKRKERCRKSAETTKRNHPDRIKKAIETRRKRAESRGYYYTEETRRKMSESHKGKTKSKQG